MEGKGWTAQVEVDRATVLRHGAGSRRSMITNPRSIPLPSTAPDLVCALRAVFDARMMDLWHQAAQQEPADPTEGVERTVHVHFTHGALHVTAVYNCMSEQFTQLIARDAAETGLERPTYTISLFL